MLTGSGLQADGCSRSARWTSPGGSWCIISSGIAALCCAIVLGRRKGYGHEEFTPHNLTMTLIGAGLLWFGWFGFNAGSALAANKIAVVAFVATNTAGATAAAGLDDRRMVASRKADRSWRRQRRDSRPCGGDAGVGIHRANGRDGDWARRRGICATSPSWLKGKLGYDDSLDVFGVHGVGGIWGVLATGLFASSVLNPAVRNSGALLRRHLDREPGCWPWPRWRRIHSWERSFC